MNDTVKTIACAAVAAALASAAWLVRPSAARTTEKFAEVGQPLAPSFTDPIAARSLEVVSFDEPTAAYKAFKVEFDGARWVIPSHNNYPADAEAKMAEAASALVGLTKEQIASDSAADHQALGVLTPDDDAAPVTGRGTRLTLRDAGGTVLTDIILGKEVPQEKPSEPFAEAPPTRRYVRLAGKNRVYATTLKAGFSTRFAEWIETDLLRLTPAEATGARTDRVDIFRARIDEKTGAQTPTERLTLSRTQNAQGADTWTLNAEPGGPPTAAEQINQQRLDEMLAALKGIRIVGVRPKPANLAKVLGGGPEAKGVQLSQGDVLSLQSRGFFLTQDGRLVANEGQLQVRCSDGVVYTLWFGEVALGGGDALSSGVGPAAESEAKPAAGESRYVFVTTSFDESILPAAPTEEQIRADNKEASDDSVKNTLKRLTDERETKMKSGRERAASLAKRFADWYYVIDAAAFAKMRPARADVVMAKPAPPPAGPVGPPPAVIPQPQPSQPAPEQQQPAPASPQR